MSEERRGTSLQIHQHGTGQDMMDINCNKDFKVDIRYKKKISNCKAREVSETDCLGM